MSADKPRNWRAQPPVQSLYSREWRTTGTRGPERFSRKFKLRIVGFLLAILVAAIVVLLAPTASRVPPLQVVTFGVGVYGGRANPQGSMPVNPFGEQDARAFQVLNKIDSAQFPAVRQEDNALNGGQFLSFLKAEADSAALSGQNLLVFCTLHGLVQPTGDVALYAIDALPDSPSTPSGAMIEVKEIITRLQNSRARRVLLVLDAARLGSNWRLGILNNDIAAQLLHDWPSQQSNSKAHSSEDDNKVSILLSASPGQQSQMGDDHSVLARVLIDGLSGKADGWRDAPVTDGSGPRDRRVSLYELTSYVRQSVEQWTRQHRGTSQTIQLLGNATDFDLTVVPTGKIPVSLADIEKANAKQIASDLAKAEAKKMEPNEADAKDGPKENSPAADSKPSDAGSTQKAAGISSAADVNWNARLEELWKARDNWRNSGGQGRHVVGRQMPLTWRAFEAQLAIAVSLQRSGFDELVPQAVIKAEAAFKKLQQMSVTPAGLQSDASEAQRQTLQELGFTTDSNPSAAALAAVGKSIAMLQKETTEPASIGSTANPSSAPKVDEPDPSVIQVWMQQELRKDTSPENWDRLARVAVQLQKAGRWPRTPTGQLLRQALSSENAAVRIGDGDALTRILSLQNRYRKLAIVSPESLPRVREIVQSGMRSLTAAERWLLGTDSKRPEVRDWIDKSDELAKQAESYTSRYLDALGIWSELLAELPGIAEWSATRLGEAERDNEQSTALRKFAQQWIERERDGRWEMLSLRESRVDNPLRLPVLERALLVQYLNAQRLKQILLKVKSTSIDDGSLDDLTKLTNQVVADHKDFWDQIQRAMPRLGTADFPTTVMWRDAERLLSQAWVPSETRARLMGIERLEPRGAPVSNRSAESNSIWQGFWAIAAVSLLEDNQEGTVDLWNDWQRLAELSHPTSTKPFSESEEEVLRRRRAELGRAIRQRAGMLRDRGRSSKMEAMPTWQLIAASLEPTLPPESDPDVHIREERQRNFADWLALFASEWRVRAAASKPDSDGYSMLAERTEGLLRELGGAVLPTPSGSPQIHLQSNDRLSYDGNRTVQLNLSVPAVGTTKTDLKVHLIGSQLANVAGGQKGQSLVLSLPADGQLAAKLKLNADVDTVQSVLVVLTESDGFPLDFREVLLYPPFDPTQWRIEFVDATTNTPVEHVPLSSAIGNKIFLPPTATVALKANLIRPIKDLTPSAKITIYRLTDSSRVPLLEDVTLKLEEGKERTAIPGDLPVPTKEKTQEPPSPKEKVVPTPLADLARGWLFEITPENQKPVEYYIRPTFWSASKFISEPRAFIRDDRLTLDLERRAVSSQEPLLPQKIRVELDIPDSLRNSLTDYTLGGAVASGQKLNLSFELPKNWQEQTRDRDWSLALNVAGLPHAQRWRIEPSGNVTPLPGQPPQLDIRLLLPPAEPKSPPRIESVVRKGKESLRLQFLVDATELDRSDELGDWTLSYVVVRQTESGSEPTPLQHSWRLFSSVERHVFLDSVQGGVWNLNTLAQNYGKEEPEAEIRGLSGRFQVLATLARSAQPSQPLATAKLTFAIDDDAPPSLEVKGLSAEAKRIDNDFSFRVEASDMESGIQRLAFGFDKNGDKVLQEDEELIEERSMLGLDNPKVNWPVIVPKQKLMPLEKEEETRNLIVQARNGVGVVATRVIPVTFRKPVLPKKMTTGTLVVEMKISRGAASSIQITGPESRLKETKADNFTFTDLPPGEYQITVKVNYAVIGRKESGEAKVNVKVGETTTAKVPLAAAK